MSDAGWKKKVKAPEKVTLELILPEGPDVGPNMAEIMKMLKMSSPYPYGGISVTAIGGGGGGGVGIAGPGHYTSHYTIGFTT